MCTYCLSIRNQQTILILNYMLFKEAKSFLTISWVVRSSALMCTYITQQHPTRIKTFILFINTKSLAKSVRLSTSYLLLCNLQMDTTWLSASPISVLYLRIQCFVSNFYNKCNCLQEFYSYKVHNKSLILFCFIQ